MMKLVLKVLLAVIWIQTQGFCMTRVITLESFLPLLGKTSLAPFKSPQALIQPDLWPSIAKRSLSSYGLSSQRRFFTDQAETKTIEIVNPCIDGFFQYGFGSPTALKGFLNTVLGFEGQKSIQNIEYLYRDMRSLDRLGYHFTVDVRCRTKEGHHFLIEMQNDFRDDYHMKTLIEYSRILSQLDTFQIPEDKEKRVQKNKKDGEKFWKGIEGVYAIVLTNKGFSNSTMKRFYPEEPLMEPSLINRYELRHTDHLHRHYGDIPSQIILLMLDNLKKTSPKDLTSPIERWAWVFKDSSLRSGANTRLSETKEIIDPQSVIGEDQALGEFIDRVNVDKLPLEIRERYTRQLRDYNECIIDIQGKAHEEGEKAKALKIARTMLLRSFDIKTIQEMTGLSLDEIQSLQTHS